MDTQDAVKRLMTPRLSEDDAYAAGRACARDGANTDNCHFGYFRSPEMTAAWERGKRDFAAGGKLP